MKHEHATHADVELPLTDVEKALSNVEKPLSDVEKALSDVEKALSDASKASSFPCPTCYKTFSQKRFYNAHIPVCKKVNHPFECEKCHKVLQSSGGLSYHRRRCEAVLVHPSEKVDNAGTVINNTTNNTVNNNTVNNTNNIHVGGNVIQNNIHINSFGNENKDYIAIEFIRQCLNQGSYGISPMIDKIYFDPEHPENHNVTLESFKNRLVKVVQENQWQFASLLNTVDQMITKASTYIVATLAQEIMDAIPTNDGQQTLVNVQSIQNIEPQMKKRIREHTKGRLARRRDTPAS